MLVSGLTTTLLVLAMTTRLVPWSFVLVPWSFVAFVGFIVVVLKMYRQRRLPRFSLRSLLLVFGLVFCLVVLRREGGAWQSVSEVPGFCLTVIFSPDARLVATIANGTDPPIEIREARTGRFLKSLPKPGIRFVTDMAFSPDGQTLLTMIQSTGPFSPTSASVHLVDWQKGEMRRKWSASRMGHISARGDRFFMYTDNASPTGPAMRVFQVDRDEPLFEVPKPKFWPRAFEDVISSTGRYLLVRAPEDAVQLWDVDAKRQVGTLTDRDFGKTNRPYIFSQFSPDDRYLALATKTGIDFWDVERFERIGRWQPAHFSFLGAIEWSPAGDRIFAMFVEKTGPTTAPSHSFLVDRKGREIAEVNGICATFSPAGDRLAVSYGGTIQILDGQTGGFLTTLGGPAQGRHSAIFMPGGNRSIFFSPDGKWLLHNGGATVWHRRRSERWFGIFAIPAFWGTDFFLIALLLPLTRKASSPATWFRSEVCGVNTPEKALSA